MSGPTAPAPTISRALASAGWNRWLYPTRTDAPLSRDPSISPSISATFNPAGFSTSTCLPARTAADATGASAPFSVATITASTAGSFTASSKLAVARASPPAVRASASARVRSRSHATAICPGARLASRFLPMSPQPTMAKRGIFMCPQGRTAVKPPQKSVVVQFEFYLPPPKSQKKKGGPQTIPMTPKTAKNSGGKKMLTKVSTMQQAIATFLPVLTSGDSGERTPTNPTAQRFPQSTKRGRKPWPPSRASRGGSGERERSCNACSEGQSPLRGSPASLRRRS